jgi:hypothetical protein
MLPTPLISKKATQFHQLQGSAVLDLATTAVSQRICCK